jgi:hypothetical protein
VRFGFYDNKEYLSKKKAKNTEGPLAKLFPIKKAYSSIEKFFLVSLTLIEN